MEAGRDLAVVTGGASGMGLATARLLAEQGYSVAVADRNVDGAVQVAEGIVARGGQAVGFEVDLEDFDSIAAFRAAVVDTVGVPTVLANVAGWNVLGPFLSDDPARQRALIAINLLGPIRVCHEFLTVMAAGGRGGRVVNVASEAGRIGNSGDVVYGAAKGGVIALTKALAREMARYRITVNCVSPGPTETPMFRDGATAEIRAKLSAGIPLRRVGQPEDVAQAIAFLVSEQSEYMTGQVLSVSGGLTMAG